MAKAKSSSQAEEKTKSRSRTALRDIKPKTPRNTFTIRQVKEEDDSPSVEPLIEDENDENLFHIDKIESQQEYESATPPSMNVSPVGEEDEEAEQFENDVLQQISEAPPKDTVKVKFGKFVNLVANRDFSDVINANLEEDIIMSSNLLTELAGASDQRGEKKIPLVFLVGIAIGVVLTYILFST